MSDSSTAADRAAFCDGAHFYPRPAEFIALWGPPPGQRVYWCHHEYGNGARSPWVLWWMQLPAPGVVLADYWPAPVDTGQGRLFP